MSDETAQSFRCVVQPGLLCNTMNTHLHFLLELLLLLVTHVLRLEDEVLVLSVLHLLQQLELAQVRLPATHQHSLFTQSTNN